MTIATIRRRRRWARPADRDIATPRSASAKRRRAVSMAINALDYIESVAEKVRRGEVEGKQGRDLLHMVALEAARVRGDLMGHFSN